MKDFTHIKSSIFENKEMKDINMKEVVDSNKEDIKHFLDLWKKDELMSADEFLIKLCKEYDVSQFYDKFKKEYDERKKMKNMIKM